MNLLYKFFGLFTREVRILQKKTLQSNEDILKHNQELIWANIYHDCIRGNEEVQHLPLNIGRWAGNYSFFYVLFRIMSDGKPQRILELGLGESSKLISTFLKSSLLTSTHLIIEHDENWAKSFKKKFELSSRSQITISEIGSRKIQGYIGNYYSDFEEITVGQKFDFYLIDGPYGSEHYSRFDIVFLVEKFEEDDEFVILFDDYNRIGEQETIDRILEIFSNKKIKIYTSVYSGLKSVLVICTERYKLLNSL